MTEPITSKISDAEWKYAQPERNQFGFIAAPGSQHKIYWEEYGNPKGEPVMFLHGGPGGSSAPGHARYFDPDRYRIILFDQRGCGKSLPKASDADPLPALTDNTTDHLISDIEMLRDKLHIKGKMHVFGGSWGSTLSLAYAIKHPENVESLDLRGIFLCRRQDLDVFYQGNAAVYDKNPRDTSLPGTYQFFPASWDKFVEVIPAEKRGDMVKAYAEIFAMVPHDEAEAAHLTKAAKAWSVWEGSTSYLKQDLNDLGKFEDAEFAKAFARIENHYFMNGAFLGGAGGEANRDNNYILDNIDKIKDIPVHIVQGRYDMVCPMYQAEDLVAALKKAGAKNVDYRLTVAGHSMFDRENAFALLDIMDNLPRMNAPERAPRPANTPRNP